MPAVLNSHQWRDRIKAGEVIAVVEIVRKCKWSRVDQVVEFVAPDGKVDSRTFDCIADGMALWNETQRNGRKT